MGAMTFDCGDLGGLRGGGGLQAEMTEWRAFWAGGGPRAEVRAEAGRTRLPWESEALTVLPESREDSQAWCLSKPQLARAGQGGQFTSGDKPVGWPCRQPAVPRAVQAGRLICPRSLGWRYGNKAGAGGRSRIQRLHSEQP